MNIFCRGEVVCTLPLFFSERSQTLIAAGPKIPSRISVPFRPIVLKNSVPRGERAIWQNILPRQRTSTNDVCRKAFCKNMLPDF